MAHTSSHVASVEEHCSLLREWLSIAGVDKAAIRDMVASAVSEKVHQHFESQMLDAMEEEPSWLAPMCNDPKWRALLCDLCAAHPDCAFLQGIIRSLSKGEHSAEIATHPGLMWLVGGASSLQAFLGSLGTQLHGRQHGHTAQDGLDGVGAAGEAQHFCAQLLLRSSPLGELECAAMLEEPSDCLLIAS